MHHAAEACPANTPAERAREAVIEAARMAVAYHGARGVMATLLAELDTLDKHIAETRGD